MNFYSFFFSFNKQLLESRGWQSLKNKFHNGILPTLSSYIPQSTVSKFKSSTESYVDFRKRLTNTGGEILKAIAISNCEQFNVRSFSEWRAVFKV